MHTSLNKIWVHKSQTKRLFLAIPLGPIWQEAFVTYQKKVMRAEVTGKVPTYWTRQANFHITVRFIGNVEKRHIPKLIEFLRQLLDTFPSMKLPFLRFEVATPSDPKMIWARFAGTPEFRALVSLITRKVAAFLKKECGGVVLKNGHHVLPHVTLARLKGTLSQTRIRSFAEYIPVTLSVESIVLNESRTYPTGTVYQTLAAFRLHTETGTLYI